MRRPDFARPLARAAGVRAFLWLRCRCCDCGVGISARYSVMEALTATPARVNRPYGSFMRAGV
jgi:hypothetical protein